MHIVFLSHEIVPQPFQKIKIKIYIKKENKTKTQ